MSRGVSETHRFILSFRIHITKFHQCGQPDYVPLLPSLATHELLAQSLGP